MGLFCACLGVKSLLQLRCVTEEQVQLWRRIEAFGFDEPGVACPFSARLARENGWTLAYAQRAIAEYRRFAFLAVASGHAVTPSKAVDEVWNLHLIYTRSYWQEFCPKVLGRPLHHEPGRGVADDEGRFAAQYAQTCASYERCFGAAPPEDIWPGRSAGQGRRAWRWKVWLPVSAVSLALAGCEGALGWPLDLAGPKFLAFFPVWCALTLLVAASLRWRLRNSGRPHPPAEEMVAQPELVAVLVGGAARLTEVTLAGLFRRGLIRLSRTSQRLTAAEATVPADLTPLESEVLDQLRGRKESPRKIARWVKPLSEPLMETLQAEGLLLTSQARTRAHLIPLAVAALGPLLGVAKIFVGVARQRPVAFLVIECAIAMAAAIVVAGRRPWRTRRGDKVVGGVRASYAELKGNPLGADKASGDTLPLALAIYGAAVLPAAGMKDLQRVLLPVAGEASGGGSGCGSSGGSSCGGGSGCGGCGGH